MPMSSVLSERLGRMLLESQPWEVQEKAQSKARTPRKKAMVVRGSSSDWQMLETSVVDVQSQVETPSAGENSPVAYLLLRSQSSHVGRLEGSRQAAGMAARSKPPSVVVLERATRLVPNDRLPALMDLAVRQSAAGIQLESLVVERNTLPSSFDE